MTRYISRQIKSNIQKCYIHNVLNILVVQIHLHVFGLLVDIHTEHRHK